MSRRTTPEQREWFAKGLRFECTMCGNCCTGPPGVIAFTREEGERIAQRLGISYQHFYDNYTHDTPVGRSLNEVETEHGHDCVFLDRTAPETQALRGGKGGGGCTLYEDRPLQCRTFPWWPHNLASERAWQRTARDCEGVGQGPLIPASHITIERQAQFDRDTSGDNL